MATKKAAKKTTTAVKVRQKLRGRPTGSMAEQIDKLEIGQSVSMSIRHALDDGLQPFDPEAFKTDLSNMQAQFGAYRSRVVDADMMDEREFLSERYTAINDAKTAIVATVVFTRTK
jgi:hypothetical protein